MSSKKVKIEKQKPSCHGHINCNVNYEIPDQDNQTGLADDYICIINVKGIQDPPVLPNVSIEHDFYFNVDFEENDPIELVDIKDDGTTKELIFETLNKDYPTNNPGDIKCLQKRLRGKYGSRAFRIVINRKNGSVKRKGIAGASNGLGEVLS